MKQVTAAIGTVILLSTLGWAEVLPPSRELGGRLMQSTFRLVGKGGQGTAFVVKVEQPSALAKAVLVTAAHVLHALQGDVQLLTLRQRRDGRRWEALPWPIRIRDGMRRFWVEDARADVAVLEVQLPPAIRDGLVSAELLADGEDIEALLPGEVIQGLGFPHGVPFVFPVLRSGPMASPLYGEDEPSFLVSFQVSPGDSGAPVYSCGSRPRIVGMVRQSLVTGQGTALELARITPADAIRAALAQLRLESASWPQVSVLR